VNRTPLLLALCGVLLAVAAVVLQGGCQPSPAPSSPAAQAEDENARLREALERTGKTMEELVAQVERQQSREAERAGDPPVARDLAVARATLTEAQKIAAGAKDSATCAAAVAQLRRVLQGIAAELPASLIVQHADRALYLIKATVAVGSTQFADASLELVASYDAANHGRPAELVPAVTGELENAIKTLKRGDTDATIKALNDVVTKALDNAALKALAQAQVEAQSAEAALGRGAWPVVGAELAQLESLLSQIVLAPSPTEKTEAAPTTTGGTDPAAGTTPPPATGAAPEGQPATQPPATTQPTGQQPVAPAAVPVGAAPPPAATPTR